VKGVFSIPYFNISEPIEMWYDEVHQQQVISYYGGMDITITVQVFTNAYLKSILCNLCLSEYYVLHLP
jgi:hypothetical protein